MSAVSEKSILIIDDDAGMLRALDRVLTAEGALVTCAEWAGDAVEVLTKRQTPFDLVITDQRMPYVTGTTLVYAIHQIFPSLPVIVLTAFSDSVVKAACLEQGAAAFLEKPMDTAQLLSVIESIFARQSSRSTDPGESRQNL